MRTFKVICFRRNLKMNANNFGQASLTMPLVAIGESNGPPCSVCTYSIPYVAYPYQQEIYAVQNGYSRQLYYPVDSSMPSPQQQGPAQGSSTKIKFPSISDMCNNNGDFEMFAFKEQEKQSENQQPQPIQSEYTSGDANLPQSQYYIVRPNPMIIIDRMQTNEYVPAVYDTIRNSQQINDFGDNKQGTQERRGQQQEDRNADQCYRPSNDLKENRYLNPLALDFLPPEKWKDEVIPLSVAIDDFFKARSTKSLRFEFKLWNALQITKLYPELFSEIGIAWISKSFLKVHRDIFGALINVTRPSAALFSSCGAFMTHGFKEITSQEALSEVKPEDLQDVDESLIRIFKHKDAGILRDSSVESINNCRWNNEARQKSS